MVRCTHSKLVRRESEAEFDVSPLICCQFFLNWLFNKKTKERSIPTDRQNPRSISLRLDALEESRLSKKCRQRQRARQSMKLFWPEQIELERERTICREMWDFALILPGDLRFLLQADVGTRAAVGYYVFPMSRIKNLQVRCLLKMVDWLDKVKVILCPFLVRFCAFISIYTGLMIEALLKGIFPLYAAPSTAILVRPLYSYWRLKTFGERSWFLLEIKRLFVCSLCCAWFSHHSFIRLFHVNKEVEWIFALISDNQNFEWKQ